SYSCADPKYISVHLNVENVRNSGDWFWMRGAAIQAAMTAFERACLLSPRKTRRPDGRRCRLKACSTPRMRIPYLFHVAPYLASLPKSRTLVDYSPSGASTSNRPKSPGYVRRLKSNVDFKVGDHQRTE